MTCKFSAWKAAKLGSLASAAHAYPKEFVPDLADNWRSRKEGQHQAYIMTCGVNSRLSALMVPMGCLGRCQLEETLRP